MPTSQEIERMLNQGGAAGYPQEQQPRSPGKAQVGSKQKPVLDDQYQYPSDHENENGSDEDYNPRLRSKGYALAYGVLASTAGIYFGYFQSIFNPLGAKLLRLHYKVDDVNSYYGNLNLFYPIGACFGCIIAGILASKVGRVRTVIGCEVFILLVYGLMLIDNIWMLQVSRFMSGIGAGITSTVGPISTTECLPKKWQGPFGVMMYIWLTVFIIVTSAMGLVWHSNDDNKMDALTHHWQLVLTWPAAIALVRLFLYLTLFRSETPQYFLDKYGPKESHNDVRDSISKIYHADDVAMVHRFLIKQYRLKSKKPQPSLLSLFSPTYIKQTVTACLFQTIQQFSGINFLVFYAVIIFNQIGCDGNMANLVLSISNTAGAILGALVCNYTGRKTNFVIGLLIQAISFWMFSMMVYYDWYTLLYLPCVLYMVSFACGMGGCSYPWAAETLPPIGVGLSLTFQWLWAAVIGKYTPVWADDWPGLLPTMIAFTTVCTVSTVVLDIMVVETKGRTENEISEEYRVGKWKPFNLF
jgi:MFS family permease